MPWGRARSRRSTGRRKPKAPEPVGGTRLPREAGTRVLCTAAERLAKAHYRIGAATAVGEATAAARLRHEGVGQAVCLAGCGTPRWTGLTSLARCVAPGTGCVTQGGSDARHPGRCVTHLARRARQPRRCVTQSTRCATQSRPAARQPIHCVTQRIPCATQPGSVVRQCSPAATQPAPVVRHATPAVRHLAPAVKHPTPATRQTPGTTRVVSRGGNNRQGTPELPLSRSGCLARTPPPSVPCELDETSCTRKARR